MIYHVQYTYIVLYVLINYIPVTVYAQEHYLICVDLFAENA